MGAVGVLSSTFLPPKLKSYLKNFYMKTKSLSALVTSSLAICMVFAGTAVFAETARTVATVGTATFVTDGRTYLGNYSIPNKLLSVDIDGLTYKGHYASHGQDMGGSPGNIPKEGWGRAFLFASSAQVLRCQLDSEFPKVSGQCQSADGRVFQIIPGTQQNSLANFFVVSQRLAIK